MCNILIFAGTTEGRQLGEFCTKNKIHSYISVATAYGETLIGGAEYLHILTGRMTSSDIESFIKIKGIQLVVDATHPYAQEATVNIKNACKLTRTEYIRAARESSQSFDGACYFDNLEKIINYLNNENGNVLITTGSKTLKEFTALNDYQSRCYARVLKADGIEEKCKNLGFDEEHIISKKPPFSYEYNLELMKTLDISYLVTKDSGTAGGFEEKIKAAIDIGAKALVLSRPEDEGISLEKVMDKITEFNNMQKKVYIIAVGMDGNHTLTYEALDAVKSCDVLIGAKRMTMPFENLGKPVFNSYISQEISDFIHSCEYENIAVLMSGDVGFYSGSSRLIPLISDLNTRTVCGVSSLVYFCSRIKISCENVCTITLHGRETNIIRNVCTHEKTFILLGGKVNVCDVCKKLCEYGLENVTVHIGENLSYPNERIVTAKAYDLINMKADNLSVMLIENDQFEDFIKSCIPDEEFVRGKIPMTKCEVRSICVSKLSVCQNDVCWDIGCGTGSVSVELALRCTNGTVFAVDKNENAVSLTKLNSIKFKCDNIKVIHSDAKEIAETLPKPDCVFIGGSSGDLQKVLEKALSKNPLVRAVITAVSLETLNKSISAFEQLNMNYSISQIAVTRTEKIGNHTMLKAENPIFVIAAGGKS